MAPAQGSRRPIRTFMRRAMQVIALLLFAPRLLLRAQTSEKSEAGWPPAFVVEHDGPSKASLRVGDSLRFTPALRNTTARPIAITHGPALFVLEAQWRKPGNQVDRDALASVQRSQLSWGPAQYWEYPNPGAPRTLLLWTKRLQPGERYAPPSLFQRSEYIVPFDSAGTYYVRVCARVDDVRVCSPSVMTIVVQ
jgi:hypothetical protein